MIIRRVVTVSLSILAISCGSANLATENKSARTGATNKTETKPEQQAETQKNDANKKLLLALPENVVRASEKQAISVGDSKYSDSFAQMSSHIQVTCDGAPLDTNFDDIKAEKLKGLLFLSLEGYTNAEASDSTYPTPKASKKKHPSDEDKAEGWGTVENLPASLEDKKPSKSEADDKTEAIASDSESDEVGIEDDKDAKAGSDNPSLEDDAWRDSVDSDCVIHKDGSIECNSESMDYPDDKEFAEPTGIYPSFGEQLVFPNTCEGKIAVNLVNLLSGETYILSAGITDAVGTPLYQGTTDAFTLESERVELKMHEIKTGSVAVDMVFE